MSLPRGIVAAKIAGLDRLRQCPSRGTLIVTDPLALSCDALVQTTPIEKMRPGRYPVER